MRAPVHTGRVEVVGGFALPDGIRVPVAEAQTEGNARPGRDVPPHYCAEIAADVQR